MVPFVNDELFFFHITKTGGTSISKSLSIESRIRNLAGYHREKDVDLHHLSPKQMNLILNEKTLKRISKMKKFCFVRNPYTRFVSEYGWRVKRNYLLSNESIEEFADNLINGVEYPFREHLTPQSDYLFYDGKPMDFIGRFERIQQDFFKMCEFFDLPKTHLPKINVSNQKSEISKDLRLKIFEFWEEDFHSLEYSK